MLFLTPKKKHDYSLFPTIYVSKFVFLMHKTLVNLLQRYLNCTSFTYLSYFDVFTKHHFYFPSFIYEPRYEKIGFLRMRKQRRGSAAQ